MLRWFFLVLGLAASGCLLADGIDLPSTQSPTDGSISTDGASDGADNGSDGLIDSPPIGEPGFPAGSGGSPCCLPFAAGGFGGLGLGGAGGARAPDGSGGAPAPDGAGGAPTP